MLTFQISLENDARKNVIIQSNWLQEHFPSDLDVILGDVFALNI